MNIREKVYRQLHFYFSDGNLRRDKFLKEIFETEGWLEVKKLITFPKLKNLLSELTDENKDELLTDIISKSDTIEFSIDKTKVRRKENYLDLPINKLADRQIYFVPKNTEMNLTVEDIEGIFFSLGRVEYVKKRKDGSFFIEFNNANIARIISNTKMEDYNMVHFPIWKEYNDKVKILKRPHQIVVNSKEPITEKYIEEVFKDYKIAEIKCRNAFSFFVFFFDPNDALKVSKFNNLPFEVHYFNDWYKG